MEAVLVAVGAALGVAGSTLTRYLRRLRSALEPWEFTAEGEGEAD